jgi:TPR repeat protein
MTGLTNADFEWKDTTTLTASELATYNAEYVNRLKIAANQGDSDALIDLGHMYRCGSHGLPKDWRKGNKLLRRALRRGNKMAWYSLSNMAPRNPIARWLYIWVWYPF